MARPKKSGGRNHRYSASYCPSTNRPSWVVTGEVRKVDASRIRRSQLIACKHRREVSMDVYLKHPATGENKKGRRGFSWTTLLLRFLAGAVPRRRQSGPLVQFALGLQVGFLTFGISSLISCHRVRVQIQRIASKRPSRKGLRRDHAGGILRPVCTDRRRGQHLRTRVSLYP